MTFGFVPVRPVFAVLLLSQVARGQVLDRARTSLGSIRGTVVDSLGGAPLSAAVVQLVGADSSSRFGRSTVSDSLGRFVFDSVRVGRYTLGFFHPVLDSLGLAAPLRQVSVGEGEDVRAYLGVPGPSRLRAAICGTKSTGDGAVIIGVVRGARDRAPAESATVVGQWLEITFGPSGFVRHIPRVMMTTGTNGWFALCNVPKSGYVAVTAFRGTDSTDLLELQMPGVGLLRRELYVGSSTTLTVPDSLSASPTLASSRQLRAGTGRIAGTVVRAVTGQPLAGAQVSIPGGPETRADERGEWVLTSAPSGSRMLDVRAVGYYPERRVADVVGGAPPIRVSMSTLLAVLDTVRITAARLNDPRRTGFQERRRSAMGRYVTAVDITRRQPRTVSEVLRGVPGIRLERFGTYVDTTAVDTAGTGTNPIGATTDTRILMRSPIKEWCFPAFYIDGHIVNTLTAEEIDSWLRPGELAGIEVYTASSVPPQFRLALSGCGSILIWRK